MPCYHPRLAYKTAGGEVVWCERGEVVETLTLPCQRCIGCRLDNSQDWAIRALHEAKYHGLTNCCFPTMTYRPEDYPDSMLAVKRDMQAFHKRLRMHLARSGRPSYRYLTTGERGDETGRLHSHSILFGYCPQDLKPWRRGRFESFRSAELEKMWPYGSVELGRVGVESCKYVARYALKKRASLVAADEKRIVVDPATGELVEDVPWFLIASTRPGIGLRWMERYGAEYFREGQCVVDGKLVPIPGYYLRKLSEIDPESAEELKLLRYVDGRKRFEDNTDERLKVKEFVRVAQLNQLKRKL